METNLINSFQIKLHLVKKAFLILLGVILKAWNMTTLLNTYSLNP